MTDETLKLRAKDAEDIEIISAVLQDSIVPICDIAFEKDESAFVAVVQRFRREAKEGEYERVCCALTVKGVTGVHTHNIDQRDPDKILDLLAIILEPAKCLNFVFAGDARIRLDLSDWTVLVEDFGEPWPTKCQPCHDKA